MGAQVRYADWPKRLNATILAARNKPFAWGVHDCCLFAADAVLAMTGVDHSSAVRGAYSTAAEAIRIIHDRGGLRGIAATTLGPEINPLMAQRGDVVLLQIDCHESLAICCGRYCVGPGESGLRSVPLTAALAAWRAA